MTNETDHALTPEEVHRMVRLTILALATIGLVLAFAATASANVYCVNAPDASCTSSPATLSGAYASQHEPGGRQRR